MSRIPFVYILRNLAERRLATGLTVAGLALVAYVFASVLMLREGIRHTLVQTGEAENVIAIRRSSNVEVQSHLERDQAALLEMLPEVASGPDGRPWVSKELAVLINLPKHSSNRSVQSDRPANVTVRGASATGLSLRPQIRLVAGRMFRPGTAEVIVGSAIARGFRGAGLDETLRFARRDWTVVGVFDAGGSGFDSELWGDAEQMMQTFNRPAYSSVVFRIADASHLQRLQQAIRSDARLQVDTKPEARFYAEQSEALVQFVGVLGTTLSLIFSVGAVAGAMVTMYANVAQRTAQIGTLRAIGFSRASILWAFLAEASCLGLLGAVVGLAGASGMTALDISTLNWQTYSELAFGFRLTPMIVLAVLIFSVAMGVVGGGLPAVRAARLQIVDALRAG